MPVLPCFECLNVGYEQKKKLVNRKETRLETTREDSISRRERGLLEDKSGRWS